MNNRTPRIALILGLATAFSMSAVASPGKMAKLDINGDTLIDKSEFLSHANLSFSAMDTDGNGLATKEERKAFRALKREEQAQKRFDRKDANGDGVISQQEDEAHRAERTEKREARRAEHRANREAGGEMRGDRERGKRGDKRQNRERFQIDANGDGVVDVAEHSAAAEHKFSKMDKNADGVLSQDELKRGKRRGGKRGPGHRKGGTDQ